MDKVDDAKVILAGLGLPPALQSLIACYTLLALADLDESGEWQAARRRSLKIHDILGFIKTRYGKSYAENTRETVRRQVLHQLEQARVVDRNPEDPELSTNSPHTHYALSADALRVVRAYNTARFLSNARRFQKSHGALLEVCRVTRSHRMIPVKLPSGVKVMLSPGKHNELQASVIRQFAPRFAPGASLLYLGDTANKTLSLETEALERMGVPVSKHGKLPDIVLHDPARDWLLLIEVVTSHGPLSIAARVHQCVHGPARIQTTLEGYRLGDGGLDCRDAGSHDPLQWR